MSDSTFNFDHRGPRLDVNEQLLQVRYDGKVHDVTASQALALDALVKADGDWVSWSGLGISKPSEVSKTLPRELLELIESAPGKGYRLRRQQ